MYFLASCASTPSSPTVNIENVKQNALKLNRAIDINVVELNPNLNSDPEINEKNGVWPELRRAESRLFAINLKKSFDKLNRFGDVNVVPSKSMINDIVISGKIITSNGEDLVLKITVEDSSGKVFINSKTYDHRTTEYFYRDLRNEGKDPFQSVYDNVVADVVKYLLQEDLGTIQLITELRFASRLNNDYFNDSLVTSRNNQFALNFIPSEDDELLVKTRNVKLQDDIFKNNMQLSYDQFLEGFDESYNVWRKAAQVAAKEKREAESAATAAAFAGALLAVAGAYASANSYNYNNNNYNFGQDLAGAVALSAGAALMIKATQDSADAEKHAETINEISKSFDSELAPQVIEFEGTTVILEGTIEDQFNQWQKILSQYYASSTNEGSDIVIKT